MATKEEVNTVLSALVNLPNCNINADNRGMVLEAFYMVLKDLEFTHLKTAAVQYLSTGTFFPTPGNLRQTALDLILSASGIPTAPEAWGDVQDAKKHIDPAYCKTGWDLREAALDANEKHNGGAYNLALEGIRKHERDCTECQPGCTKEVYAHPVIEETVRRLGGRDALITDNPAADRARFIDAYREIVERERKEVSRIPEVAQFIDARRAELAEDMTKRLGDAMRPARQRAISRGDFKSPSAMSGT